MGASTADPSQRSLSSLHAALVLLVLALGCDTVVDPAGEAPAKRVFVHMSAGNNQAAEVGTNLAQPLVVELRDAAGMPEQGIGVLFRSSHRGSRSMEVKSDSLGRAWVWWQLGEESGSHRIMASVTAPNVSDVVSFDAIALPGPPAFIRVTSEMDLRALPGTQLDPIDVRLEDRFANATANVALSWAIETGGGTIRAVVDRTDGAGRARAIWTLGMGTGPQSIHVVAGSATHRIRAHPGRIFPAMQVVSGSDHSCALTNGGVAHCWGSNAFAQLGIGERDWNPHRHPLAVQTSVRFKSLAAGAVHTCGLAIDGTTWCWGGNRAQQAGDVHTDVVTAPTRLFTPAFVALAAGGYHTCGLTAAGVASCWGDDSFGQLGRRSDRSDAEFVFEFGHHRPEPVEGLVFSSIAASYSATCGVTTSGSSYCWGANEELILGNLVGQKCRMAGRFEYNYDSVSFWDHACSSTPVPVPTSTSVASLTMDQNGACARLTSSEVACWGRGQPGPTTIPSARVSTLWSAGNDVCGVTVDDTIACWVSYAPFPSSNPLGSRILIDISSSGRHTCGLTKPPESAVFCWGTNYSGELGDGTTTHRDLPVGVSWP